MTDDYLSLMMTLARDAGLIALKHLNDGRSDLKADHSVITEADRAISRLTHERLAPLLAQGDHILIDEEDPKRGEYLDQAFLESKPFIWSVDPIDGTRVYANRMRHYGFSLGLIKDLRPWLGVVYFPSLSELFYCDGADAYFVKDAFTDHEVRTKIVPVDEVITNRSIFIATDEVLSLFEWQERECRCMIFATAICEFCWPTIGRGCGSLSMVHLWDFAGSWPIFQRAGFELRSFDDGRVLDQIRADLFRKEGMPWRLKEYYILSSKRNYPELRSRLTRRVR
ncbi:MAG: hypothetical protein HQL18_03955 [Candidatus Omnitrophica bacterium]|nr:hypothetical protein [Candidatus Omnitrophota bacterium]